MSRLTTRFAVGVALASLIAAPFSAISQQTKSQLNSYNNTNIKANGTQAITGPILNTDIANIITSMCGIAQASDCPLPAGTVANSLGNITGGYVFGNGTGSSALPSPTPLISVMQQSGSGLGSGVASAAANAVNANGGFLAYNSAAFGLGFGLAPGSVTRVSGGSGYAVGDSITLACSGATFSVAPVVSVNAISGSAVNGVQVINPGATSALSSTPCTFTQASTSGSGSGATFGGSFAVISAALSQPLISTGGSSTNGNMFSFNGNPNVRYGGSEGTFWGAYAGDAFIGANFGDSAFGEDACGGNQGAFTNNGPGGNDCYGNDAGRNFSGSGGQNVFVGQNAGRGDDVLGNTGNQNTYVGNGSGKNNTTGSTNVGVGVTTLNSITTGINNLMAGAYAGSSITTGIGNVGLGRFGLTTVTTGQFNTAVGTNSQSNATGSSNVSLGAGTLTFATGSFNNAIGQSAGASLISGTNNILIGPGVASTTLTTGSYNIYLGGGANCDAATASETNTFRLCETSGTNSAIQANLTAGQVVVTVDGPVALKSYTVAGLPTCNAGAAGQLAYVTDATAPTFNSTLTGGSTVKVMALCNGANWTAH